MFPVFIKVPSCSALFADFCVLFSRSEIITWILIIMSKNEKGYMLTSLWTGLCEQKIFCFFCRFIFFVWCQKKPCILNIYFFMKEIYFCEWALFTSQYLSRQKLLYDLIIILWPISTYFIDQRHTSTCVYKFLCKKNITCKVSINVCKMTRINGHIL